MQRPNTVALLQDYLGERVLRLGGLMRNASVGERKLPLKDQFHQFFEITPESCYILSVGCEILDANPAACKALGYNRDELIGRLLPSLSPPESALKIQKLCEEWKHDRQIHSENVVVQTKFGQERTVLLSMGSFKGPDGKVLLLTCVQLDIPETKHEERPLRASEERLRLLSDAAPMLMWISGPDKLCTYLNKAWLDFTGRSLEAELGNGWAEGVHLEDVDRCLEAFNQSFDRREEFTLEYRLRRNDGEYRWIFDVGMPRFSQNGEFEGYIGFCADVTDRKQVEAERIRLREEIAYLNRAASIGQVASSLVHELSQPLAAILSNAQAAARFASQPEPDIEEIRTALFEIIEDEHRASAFVHNLQAMLQRRPVTSSPLDLNRVVYDVTRIIRIDAVSKGAQVRVNLAPGALLVLGDTIAVQQIILNLAKNAMDAFQHMPSGLRILTLTTEARTDSSSGTIWVEDSGPGISEEQKAMLFKPFFTTKPDGLGLGLSICRSLAESVGGKVELVDRSAPGALFRVDLPLVK
jgi:PAS domain S-box-containing protein